MFALILFLLTYKIMIMFFIGAGYIGHCVDGSFYFLSSKKMENELTEPWLNPVSCVNSHSAVGKTKVSQFIYRQIRQLDVERDSSVVECRTHKRESPGSNPLCYRFEVWAFSFTSRRFSQLSWINEYLTIDSGGHVSE